MADASMCRYEIHPRPKEFGGGWNLKFYDDDVEAGGGVFPADPNKDPVAGIAWFSSLPKQEQARWLTRAGSKRTADAWAVYLGDQAFDLARDAGEDWLAGRG